MFPDNEFSDGYFIPLSGRKEEEPFRFLIQAPKRSLKLRLRMNGQKPDTGIPRSF